MAKKTVISILAIIILSLCCGMCFAEEGNDSVNLGNEIMESMNKTGESVQNVISGNIVGDTKNMVEDGANNIKNTAEDMGNKMEDGMNNMDNRENRDMTGNYNTTRTVSEATTTENGFATMTTTTWMWIILVVAAIIIIAAIWYYATQDNS